MIMDTITMDMGMTITMMITMVAMGMTITILMGECIFQKKMFQKIHELSA